MLRFTYTRKTEGPDADVPGVTTWKVDPWKIIAVGGDHEGVVLLLDGRHAMRVDGTLEIVAAKVEAAKRGDRLLPEEEPEAPRLSPIEKIQSDVARRLEDQMVSPETTLATLDEGDDLPFGVEMMEHHDGPAEVD